LTADFADKDKPKPAPRPPTTVEKKDSEGGQAPSHPTSSLPSTEPLLPFENHRDQTLEAVKGEKVVLESLKNDVVVGLDLGAPTSSVVRKKKAVCFAEFDVVIETDEKKNSDESPIAVSAS
jgi:hypothetical protein